MDKTNNEESYLSTFKTFDQKAGKEGSIDNKEGSHWWTKLLFMPGNDIALEKGQDGGYPLKPC